MYTSSEWIERNASWRTAYSRRCPLSRHSHGPFRFNTPYTRDSRTCLLEHHVESLPTRTQEGDVYRKFLLLSLISSSSLHSLWTRSCLYIFMVAERSAALCVVLIFSLTSLSTTPWKRLLRHKSIILGLLYVVWCRIFTLESLLSIFAIGYSRQ